MPTITVSGYRCKSFGFMISVLSDDHKRNNGLGIYLNLFLIGAGLNLSFRRPEPQPMRVVR